MSLAIFKGSLKLLRLIGQPDNCAIKLRLPAALQSYIFSKGFIAVDGISLTVGEVNDGVFGLYLIPETLSVTTLGERKVGDLLNIEMDQQSISIVQTVERVLAARGLS